MLIKEYGPMKYRQANPEMDGGIGDLPADPGTSDWRSMISEDLRESPTLKDFKDIDSLAKSYVHTKSALGNSIRIPGEDAGEDARREFAEKLMKSAPNLMMRPDFDNPDQSKEFFRTLGMPETPDAYKFPEVEGIEMPEDRGNALRQAAHEAGITTKQFEKVMKHALELDAKSMQDYQSTLQQELAGLKQEWGNAYDQNFNKAALIAQKTGAPQNLVDAIGKGQVGADTIKWLHSLAGKFGNEGREFIEQQESQSDVMVPAEAKERINEIMANKQHPYWIASHPEHRAALDKMVQLQRMSNPQRGG